MTVSYNPFDPAQVDHDEEVLTQLRHETRVAELMPGVFYVTHHEDVAEISRDAKRFPQAPFRPLEEDTRAPDELQLGESNPPGHTKVRKILASVLSPPRIRALEPLVDSVCADLVDAFAPNGSADLIADLGRPLPAQVIGELTGVPAADRHFLHEYSDLVVVAVQEQDPSLQQVAIDRVAEFDAHFLDVIRERRNATDKPDDAMTALIEYRDEDGNALSDEKVLLHLSKDLITGGIDTTTHLVGNLFYDILTTPGTYERLRDDRSLVPIAVEECLRHRPVVNVLFRRPAEDQEFAGVTIPAGSTVALGYSSANHDETVFECPEKFDLDRGDVIKRQLGFGWGVHLCVGAPLARLEGAHVLNAVLDRIPAMRLASEFEYQRVKMFMMRGPVALDVEFDPRELRDPVEEIRETPDGPALKFVHVDEVESQEVVAQMHGDRRVGVHLKFLEWTKDRMVAFTYYDPGLILERHAHESDALVFVIEGDVEVGGHPCPPGTLIVLEKGAAFGPLIAGPDGCTFLECYGDDVRPAPVDKDGYFKTLAERGIERLPNPVWQAPPGAPVRERGEEDNWS